MQAKQSKISDFINDERIKEIAQQVESEHLDDVKDIMRNVAADEKTFAELKDMDPQVLDALYTLGYQYATLDELDNAIKIFQALCILEHTNKKYRLAFAGALFKAGDYLAAQLQYAYLVSVDKKNLDAIYWLFKTIDKSTKDKKKSANVAEYFLEVAQSKGDNLAKRYHPMAMEAKVYVRKYTHETLDNTVAE